MLRSRTIVHTNNCMLCLPCVTCTHTYTRTRVRVRTTLYIIMKRAKCGLKRQLINWHHLRSGSLNNHMYVHLLRTYTHPKTYICAYVHSLFYQPYVCTCVQCGKANHNASKRVKVIAYIYRCRAGTGGKKKIEWKIENVLTRQYRRLAVYFLQHTLMSLP